MDGSEQARAVAGHDLLAVRSGGSTPPKPVPDRPRVLDLTRVLAGPVATRALAQLGCDVLRVDSPHLPELDAIHLDTDSGKRSTLVDLQDEHARHRVHDLLAAADVLVTGYRPGALTAYGLDPERLAEQHPHLVCASLSAWTPTGPWGPRRGFDSIVQAATGISLIESRDGRAPGALPAQALDHATGYLLAAGVLAALRRRADGGRDLAGGGAPGAHRPLVAADRRPRRAGGARRRPGPVDGRVRHGIRAGGAGSPGLHPGRLAARVRVGGAPLRCRRGRVGGPPLRAWGWSAGRSRTAARAGVPPSGRRRSARHGSGRRPPPRRRTGPPTAGRARRRRGGRG